MSKQYIQMHSGGIHSPLLTGCAGMLLKIGTPGYDRLLQTSSVQLIWTILASVFEACEAP